MDPIRFGRGIRVLRQRRGWRQEDLAAAAGLSQPVVSRIELGDLASIAVGRLERVVRALGASFDLGIRWHGAAFDGLIDAAHARLVEEVVRLLVSHGWEAVAEASFSIYGERGSIDVFARHVVRRRLAVVEVKSELGDLQATLAALDRKLRNAPAVARDRGWAPWPAARILVVAESASARRRVAEHEATLRTVLPLVGRPVRQWLQEPEPATIGGVWFLSGTRTAGVIGSNRVRRSRRTIAHPAGG